MKLGVDIDGVLADSLTIWLEHLNQHFGQNKKREDVKFYQFEKVYDVTWKEMDSFFREKQGDLLRNLKPIEDAQQTMGQLAKEHKLILITARPEEFRQITVDWLAENHFPYEDLVMTDFNDKTCHCLDFGLDLFIEDSLENAFPIHGCGIPVLLLDAPYNRVPLPSGILRQSDWKEIYQTVQEIHHGKRQIITYNSAGK